MYGFFYTVLGEWVYINYHIVLSAKDTLYYWLMYNVGGEGRHFRVVEKNFTLRVGDYIPEVSSDVDSLADIREPRTFSQHIVQIGGYPYTMDQ